MTHILRTFALLAPAILVFAGCADRPQRTGPDNAPIAACPACVECQQCPVPARATAARYEQTSFAAIPGWQSAVLAPGLRAFGAGCARIAPSHHLRRACDSLSAAAPGDEQSARQFIETSFSALAITSGEGVAEGLITGYYEPVLPGSRSRTERFRHPVYGTPDDLVAVDLESVNPDLKGMRLRGRVEGKRLVPYWSRAEIENQKSFRAPVLAWVEDPVELFFLQIQGSGQIELAQGERLRIGYADQNGHPYRSIGRYLVERRELTLDQASMQGIKAWAAANPGKLREALDSNPSYVFFRAMPHATDGADGPIGTLGVPLTAGHSIAIDPRSVPLGALVFLATTMPQSSQPLQRLVAAQDTGGAIRGAVRADFYWGSGSEAGALAGRMRQQGWMWILWPRGEPLPKP
jgi:membrane-bound lytic murein transglycosylase A